VANKIANNIANTMSEAKAAAAPFDEDRSSEEVKKREAALERKLTHHEVAVVTMMNDPVLYTLATPQARAALKKLDDEAAYIKRAGDAMEELKAGLEPLGAKVTMTNAAEEPVIPGPIGFTDASGMSGAELRALVSAAADGVSSDDEATKKGKKGRGKKGRGKKGRGKK